MADLRYALNTMQVVSVDAGMPPGQIAAVLNSANTIVLVQGGTYVGDLAFTAANVVLFGEDENGGEVTINGNVTVNGPGNRIRNARINGSLQVTGNGFGMSFSQVRDAVRVAASSSVFLQNRLCDGGVFTGPAHSLLGNEGLSPVALDGGC
jgi:hypothetical protein